MRIVLQRVSSASVSVDGSIIGSIGRGYVLLLCVMKGDTEADVDRLAEKICGLRLFDGADGKINDRSLLEIAGEVLVISQFTLAADLAKGRRPDYTAAAGAQVAQELYEGFQKKLLSLGVKMVQGGRFGALMQVSLVNDGPVTLLLDTALS